MLLTPALVQSQRSTSTLATTPDTSVESFQDREVAGGDPIDASPDEDIKSGDIVHRTCHHLQILLVQPADQSPLDQALEDRDTTDCGAKSSVRSESVDGLREGHREDHPGLGYSLVQEHQGLRVPTGHHHLAAGSARPEEVGHLLDEPRIVLLEVELDDLRLPGRLPYLCQRGTSEEEVGQPSPGLLPP